MTETIQGGGGKYYTADDSVATVRAITVPSNVQMSGQITVTTAGTAVQGTSITAPNGFYIKAMAANTGALFVGNDGASDVASTNGFELSGGEVVTISVENLNELWFDAATNGNVACWIKA